MGNRWSHCSLMYCGKSLVALFANVLWEIAGHTVRECIVGNRWSHCSLMYCGKSLVTLFANVLWEIAGQSSRAVDTLFVHFPKSSRHLYIPLVITLFIQFPKSSPSDFISVQIACQSVHISCLLSDGISRKTSAT